MFTVFFYTRRFCMFLHVSFLQSATFRFAGFKPEKDSLELYHIEIISDGSDPEAKLLAQEQQELIQKAIHSLPEKCREVFRLFLSDKLKQKEIAVLLAISQKTVEAHIATAYKKIYAYLKKAD